MKKFSIIFLSLLSLNAMALSRQQFAGEFKLEKTLTGACPKVLKVETTTFLDETSSPSLQFSCEYDSEGCRGPIVYQLPDINTGKRIAAQENPMSGVFDSVYFSHQTLRGDTITADDKVTDIFGNIHWHSTFKAVLKGNKLSYEFSEVNNIVNEGTRVIHSSCNYTRK